MAAVCARAPLAARHFRTSDSCDHARMARRSEFVEHVVETMRAFGPVEAEAMFGGWGLYCRGAFFAIVVSDTLYFKTDPVNRARFEAAGLEGFVFTSKGGAKTTMSYRRAPDEALDNAEVMAEWAKLGYEAALRAAAAKGKRPAPRPSRARRRRES
jgi:DNA transformation protein and related proteins